jgi:DNA modification methylase
MIDEIICGHNVSVLAGLEPASVDLTVTSPPYDSLRRYNGYTFDFEGVAQQLYRVTRPGGVVVWVVADETVNGSETGTSFRQALHFMALGFNLHDTMIYHVNGTGAKGSNYAYWQAFEYMFVFSKGRPKTVNRLADKRNIRAGAVVTRGRLASDGSIKDTKIRPVLDYGVRENVWSYLAGNNGDTSEEHPAPFPEKLAQDHILSWSNPSDLVLDPFVGSGTTCKMAIKHHRHYIGIDVSPEYCDLARRRIATVQQTLFPLEVA